MGIQGYENEDDMFITLEMEDGSEEECVVLDIFELNGKEYIALAPAEPDEELFRRAVGFRTRTRKNPTSISTPTRKTGTASRSSATSKTMTNSKPSATALTSCWTKKNSPAKKTKKTRNNLL